MTQFIETQEGMNLFYFVCKGCRSEGNLKIPVDAQRVNCPENCGASYIQWINPRFNKPELMPVIVPVFKPKKEN